MPLEPAIVSDSRPLMVTGAGGFIGSHIVAELDARGEHVLAVVRRRLAHMNPARSEGKVEYVECDLRNRSAVVHLIERHRPEACVHAAWDVASPHYMTSPLNQDWVRISLHMAGHLMRCGCRWLGFCGTHIEPAEPCGPSNRYAAAKATLRHRVQELASSHEPSCRVAWFHIFQPYGPGERDDRLIPSLIAAAINGEAFELKDPNALRDLIHVHDVARAVAEAAQNRLRGRFDVGTGRVRFLHEVAALVHRIAGSQGTVHLAADDERARPVDPVNRVANVQPLTDETGWRPTLELETGLQSLIAQMASRLAPSA